MSDSKKIKPALSKGTRDFLPAEVARRNYIFSTIKSVFYKYGFEQIETPAIERLDTLTGKYGEEGDKLLFKILNSGDYLEKVRANKSVVKRIAALQNFLEDIIRALYPVIINNLNYFNQRDDYTIRNLFRDQLAIELDNWGTHLSDVDKSFASKYLNDNLDKIVNLLYQAFTRANVTQQFYIDNHEHYFRMFRDIVLSEYILPEILDINRITSEITEKGLRYDLTVPLARYVVQNQDNLAFPFRRFHIAPVWRADRPQKGRYQEFYQCDADIIGSNSLLNEVELTFIYAEVFEKLGISTIIQLNNRKFLQGIAAVCGAENHFSDFTAIIDKDDKIGVLGVRDELNVHPNFRSKNVGDNYYSLLIEASNVNDKNLLSILSFYKTKFSQVNSMIGLSGINEVEQVFGSVISRQDQFNKCRFLFTMSLARGLNYYTGTIWEVVLDQNIYQGKVTMGSLGGGGRYDNLTEMFGGQNMSGVGISFGIERIYDVMEELNLFPTTISQGVKVLFVPRDISVEEFTFQQVSTLREKGIPAEIFLGNVKKQKQFDYVERKNIAYLVEIGDNEKNTGLFRLRNAQTRETRNDLTISDIVDLIAVG